MHNMANGNSERKGEKNPKHYTYTAKRHLHRKQQITCRIHAIPNLLHEWRSEFVVSRILGVRQIKALLNSQ